MSNVQSQEVFESFHGPIISSPHPPKGHPLLKKVRILTLREIKLSLQGEDALGAIFEVIGSHNSDLPENRKILPGRIPAVTNNRAVFMVAVWPICPVPTLRRNSSRRIRPKLSSILKISPSTL
jgi:hypothetical protein